MAQMQVLAESLPGYAPGGADPLRDHRIERFDFRQIVGAFDAARAAGFVGQWAMMDALLTAHLAGSDSEALGGDLAYRYGSDGSLAQVGLSAAQSILDAGGPAPQPLRSAAELGADPIKLAG
jgi:hypothetical protein